MSPEDTNPQPALAGRVVSGVLVLTVVYCIFALREFSRGVASFTGATSHDSSMGVAIFLSLTLGPSFFALFVPRRSIVMVAGLCMLPYILMAIIYLLMPPIGMVLLLPPFVWCRAVLRPILAQPLYE